MVVRDVKALIEAEVGVDFGSTVIDARPQYQLPTRHCRQMREWLCQQTIRAFRAMACLVTVQHSS